MRFQLATETKCIGILGIGGIVGLVRPPSELSSTGFLFLLRSTDLVAMPARAAVTKNPSPKPWSHNSTPHQFVQSEAFCEPSSRWPARAAVQSNNPINPQNPNEQRLGGQTRAAVAIDITNDRRPIEHHVC